jgi:diguanylate cyclase (GGDEF)-like protein
MDRQSGNSMPAEAGRLGWDGARHSAEALPASLWVDLNGLILDACPQAERMFFAKTGELPGRPYGYPLALDAVVEIDLLQPNGGRIAALTHTRNTLWKGQAALQVDIVPQHHSPQAKVAPGGDLLRALVNQSPLAIVVVGLNGHVTLWNAAATKLFSRSDVEMRGHPLPDNCEEYEDSLLGMFERTLSGETLCAYEVTGLQGGAGRLLDVEVWTVRMGNEQGLPAGVLMMMVDIAERKKIEAHIRHVVGHDTLTGLPNRQQFRKQLQRLLYRKKPDEHVPTLIMQLGLDRFREINKSLGPGLGDHLLQQASRRLAEALYETDLLARTGGDEFSILLRGTQHIQDGVRVADRLRHRLAEPFQLLGQEVSVTASIGLAVAPNDGLEAEDLLRAADSALARAKEQGGDNCQYFSHELDGQARHRLLMENALRHAVERAELFLEYQPQYHLGTRRIVGVEALLRWRHPEFGLIPPAVFIPVAENCGLIESIGKWVLLEACRQLRVWDALGMARIRMAVNVSVRQFRTGDFHGTVEGALIDNQLTGDRLELELTESMLMKDTAETIRILERLKALGVVLAIDDFGTGFSSLSYLAEFPIDTLKIDQSFVRGPDGQVRNGLVVRAICTLAAGLGMRTIAEGVEHSTQLEFLQGIGCDEVQGYLLARPMSADRVGEILQHDDS